VIFENFSLGLPQSDLFRILKTENLYVEMAAILWQYPFKIKYIHVSLLPLPSTSNTFTPVAKFIVPDWGI